MQYYCINQFCKTHPEWLLISLMGWTVSPPNLYIEALTPSSVLANMKPYLEIKSFNKVKLRSLGSTQIQCNRCPNKKSTLEHRRSQNKAHVSTQGDGHLPAKESGLRENPPCWRSGTSHLHNGERTRFCHLSRRACATLFWQPYPPHTALCPTLCDMAKVMTWSESFFCYIFKNYAILSIWCHSSPLSQPKWKFFFAPDTQTKWFRLFGI